MIYHHISHTPHHQSKNANEEEHTLLAGRLFDLGSVAVANFAVVRLEFLEVVVGVVNQSKTSRLPATELGAESKNGDRVFVGLVKVGKLGAELILGDVGSVGVEDITVA